MTRLALLAILCLAVPVTAGVVSRDLFEPGDGLLTYDDVNGREWLDFSVTRDLRLNEVSSAISDDGSLAGFQMATGFEITQLGQSASGVAASWRSQADSLASHQLLAVLAADIAEGRYYVDELRTSAFHAFLGPSRGGMIEVEPNLVFVWSRADYGYSGFFDPALDPFSFPWPGTKSAYWLYREAAPAPEPTAALLAVTACLGTLRLRVSA